MLAQKTVVDLLPIPRFPTNVKACTIRPTTPWKQRSSYRHSLRANSNIARTALLPSPNPNMLDTPSLPCCTYPPASPIFRPIQACHTCVASHPENSARYHPFRRQLRPLAAAKGLPYCTISPNYTKTPGHLRKPCRSFHVLAVVLQRG